MSESVYLGEIIRELERGSKDVREEDLRSAAERIRSAERVFVAGAGRSGFAARAFSNRLMHLGLTVFFAGDSTTPPIQKGDALFIISGSGETASLVSMAKKAAALGSDVLTLTVHPEASIGRLSCAAVCLPGGTKSSGPEDGSSMQVMGDMFEQLSWLVCDVIVHYLMESMGVTKEDMVRRHANLE